MIRQPYRAQTPTAICPSAQNGRSDAFGDHIAPSRAASGVARWRRALSTAKGEEPSAGLEEPRRLLTMLKVFGSTRRFADLCLTFPNYAATALTDGPTGIIAEAARDLSSLDDAIGGPEALYGALAPIKARVDIAIGLAEISGAWSVSEAATARTDFAERLIETALAWLVRSAVSRGELSADAHKAATEGVFAVAGGDFAHEDLAPSGPIDLLVVYAPDAFAAIAGRPVDRAFVRIGAELREALEGRPGDFPIFTLTTPMGSGVNGAGLVETVAAVSQSVAASQNAHLRRWFSGARLVAGDRTAGGAFLERLEGSIWGDEAIFTTKTRETLLAGQGDVLSDLRAAADILRWSLGRIRPVFRTAPASEVFAIAAQSGVLTVDAAGRLGAGFDIALRAASCAQMVKGVPGGVLSSDEAQAVARLCGYDDDATLNAVLGGARAEARSTLARLIDGPHYDIRLYKDDREDADADDVEKLEDLGFQNGAGLASLLDGWATLCARADGERFASIAPGLITEFGETQHPDEAVRLFDMLIRTRADADNEGLASRLSEPTKRRCLVNALGNFGAAVEPVIMSGDNVPFTADTAMGAPECVASFFERYPAPVDGDAAAIGDWRRRAIGRCAVHLADGGTPFEIGADLLERIQAKTFARLFALSVEATGARDLTLHQFEAPGYALPGVAAPIGFMRAGGDEAAAETTARRFIESLDQLGGGFFAVAPDVSHRPGGVAGGLAPTHDAFRDYVRSEAVAADQILLARSRVIAGDEEAAAGAARALRSAVSNPRRADILFRDLDRARGQRMRRAGQTSHWDIETVEGGLHDVELIISTLIYRHAGAQPALQTGDAAAAIDLMARANLIPGDVAETLKAARSFWRRMAVIRSLARWSDPQIAPVRKSFANLIARAAEVETFAGVRPIMRGYAEDVSRLYAQLVLGRPSLSLVANG